MMKNLSIKVSRVSCAIGALVFMSGATQAASLVHMRFEEGSAGNAATGANTVLNSASTNHGTPSGSPVYSADVPTALIPQTGASNGRSLDFDGTDDTVIISTNTALDSAGSFTVEFWMRSSDTSGGQHLLVDKSHGFGDTTGWFFQSGSGNGFIAFGLGNGSSFPGVGSTADLFDDTWHHLAGTYDGNVIEFFVDGVSQGTEIAGVFNNNTRDVRIGSARNNGRFFDGKIDEVRISDEVLSTSEFLNVPESSSTALIGLSGLALLIRRQRIY